MKTFFKTYTWKQAIKKRGELEKKTGVKWDYYSLHAGVKFTPVLNEKIAPDALYVYEIDEVLTEYAGTPCSFLLLEEEIGCSLSQVVAGVAHLKNCNYQTYKFYTNRLGNIHAIEKRI